MGSWGEGKEWRYELLDVRQAQGCIEQNSEYSQYFLITANRNLENYVKFKMFISKISF